MALDSEVVRDLILDIYDTSLDPRLWPTVLDQIAEFVGARGAFLFELEGEEPDRVIIAPYFSGKYQPEQVLGYLARHNRQELLDQDSLAFHSKRCDGIELVGENVLYESRAEYLDRPNVQEMLANGIHHRAGALLNKDFPRRDRFALQFSRRDGPLSDAHRRRAALVLPHVAKALSIARPTLQLENRFNSIVGCLDMLQIGICILSRTGTVVLTNSEFDRQVQDYPVYSITAERKLELNDRDLGRQLAAFRSDVSRHGRRGARPHKEAIITHNDVDARALCLEICPLTSNDHLDEPRLDGHIVYSLDSAMAVSIDAGLVAGAFGLTHAEQQVLDLLSEGLTNAEISERRKKSIETVNSQVKSILAKTNSANRTQLLRLVTGISANYVRGFVESSAHCPQHIAPG